MLAAGFLDEVRALRTRGDLDPDLPALRSVGYRQAWEHFGQGTPLAQLRAEAVAATRQLAKRQITWLRSMSDATRSTHSRPGCGRDCGNWSLRTPAPRTRPIRRTRPASDAAAPDGPGRHLARAVNAW